MMMTIMMIMMMLKSRLNGLVEVLIHTFFTLTGSGGRTSA